MKHVQILMNDDLLNELDNDEEVKKLGRSEVFRRLAADYLKRKRAKKISKQYTRAYVSDADPHGDEFDGWAEEGVWPAS